MLMGVIYFVAMSLGALGFRVPPAGWRPSGWTPTAQTAGSMITNRHVHLNVAWRTPQFWLIWGVLGLNVTAGIAVIAMASPMFQEVFGGRLLGLEPHAALSRRAEGGDRGGGRRPRRPDQPVQQRRPHPLGVCL